MKMPIQDKAKLFKSLSDPNRLRILKMLQTKSLCVCEITAILDLATSTVSKHLSILRDSGFIIEEKDGKWVNYMINPKPSDPRISSLLSSLDFWIADEQSIISDKQKALSVDRNEVCAR
jgi:ArsR family transcriptional regulator, arsenate/arsenite/antimonite-responsive transcriptional repressor